MENKKICTNPQCFCDGSCKGIVKSDANYSSEATMENKTAEEMITRGTGNFINCTDYEDAISVIKNLQQQLAEKDKEIESYMSLLDDASKTVVEKDKEIEMLKDESDEKLLNFIDWFGSWQTDKRLEDYGINDVLENYKQSLNK